MQCWASTTTSVTKTPTFRCDRNGWRNTPGPPLGGRPRRQIWGQTSRRPRAPMLCHLGTVSGETHAKITTQSVVNHGAKWCSQRVDAARDELLEALAAQEL